MELISNLCFGKHRLSTKISQGGMFPIQQIVQVSMAAHLLGLCRNHHSNKNRINYFINSQELMKSGLADPDYLL